MDSTRAQARPTVEGGPQSVLAVAASVLGRDGSAKAAISIVGPSRGLLSGIGRPAQLVQVAARRLSRELSR